LYKARVFVRLGWEGLPSTNDLSYYGGKKFYKIDTRIENGPTSAELFGDFGDAELRVLLLNTQPLLLRVSRKTG
jgi:hypothetical protein